MRNSRDIVLMCLFLFFLIVLVDNPPKEIIAFRNFISKMAVKDNGAHDNRPLINGSHGDSSVRHTRFTGSTMYSYWPPDHSSVTRPGDKFEVDIRLAKKIKSMSHKFISLTEQTVNDFVFVTAASQNHFDESIDCVASIQNFFPGKMIFYYDIGLRSHQIDMVRSWRDVVIRKFDFARYPEYFHDNLRLMGWKPIIIQEVLAEYGGVFWMDASVRLLTNDLSKVYKQVISESGGIALFKTTKHSTFAATHKRMYDYIPTNRTRQMTIPMCLTTAILIYNTRQIFYNVVWWLCLCALDRDCHAPMERNMCDYDIEVKWENFANCHKFEQSAINILLSNLYGYKLQKYLSIDQVLSVERWPTNHYRIVFRNPQTINQI